MGLEYFVEGLEVKAFSLIVRAVFSNKYGHLIVQRANNVGKPFDLHSQRLAEGRNISMAY